MDMLTLEQLGPRSAVVVKSKPVPRDLEQTIYGAVVLPPQKRQRNIWSDYGRLHSDSEPFIDSVIRYISSRFRDYSLSPCALWFYV
jgi:hypothetical protein